MLKENHLRLSPVRQSAMLESIGYRMVCRASSPLMHEDLKRPNLFIRRDLYRDGLTVDDYCVAQGYPLATRGSTVLPFGRRG